MPALLGNGKNEKAARACVAFTWLLRAGKVAKGTHVTNAYKRDGIGSQLIHTLDVQAFAEAFSIPYAHTRIDEVSQKQRTFDQRGITAWEERVQFHLGYPKVEELGLPLVPLETYVRLPEWWARPAILSHVSPVCYLDFYRNGYDEMIARKRAALEQAEPLWNDSVSVAIHVRRGDVTLKRHPGRYTAVDAVHSYINAIRRELKALRKTVSFTVFSDGKPKDFVDLSDQGIELCLGGDALDDFIAMQESDILLIGKSCFSQLAGLLHRRNLVIYQPWWLRPRPGWLKANAIEGGLRKLLEGRGLLAA